MPATKPATKGSLVVFHFYQRQQNCQLPENKINVVSSLAFL